MSALENLRELPSQVQQIRDGLEALFKNLPSNPAADHQGKNFFRMKQSDMVNGIISPDYYHFESQHEALRDLVQTFPLDKIQDDLVESYDFPEEYVFPFNNGYDFEEERINYRAALQDLLKVVPMEDLPKYLNTSSELDTVLKRVFNGSKL